MRTVWSHWTQSLSSADMKLPHRTGFWSFQLLQLFNAQPKCFTLVGFRLSCKENNWRLCIIVWHACNHSCFWHSNHVTEGRLWMLTKYVKSTICAALNFSSFNHVAYYNLTQRVLFWIVIETKYLSTDRQSALSGGGGLQIWGHSAHLDLAYSPVH